MMVEIALVLSALSLIFNIYTGISNMKRGHKQDVKEDTSQIASVLVKLENISAGIAEIKNDINSIKNDVREDHDRIIRLEESSKQAHKRIDEIGSK